MNHEPHETMAVWADQPPLVRDPDGSVFRGLAFAMLANVAIVALCWFAYELGFFGWFRDHALYLILGAAVISLGAVALHQGIRAGMNGE